MTFTFLNKLFGLTSDENLQEFINKDTFLVDVRTPSEFRYGSIKGAVNIPLSDVMSNLKKFKGKKNIVVFCRSGNRSGQAKRILESNGITNVANGGSVGNMKKICKKQKYEQRILG